MIRRQSVMNPNEVKSYFQSLLSPPSLKKIHPEPSNNSNHTSNSHQAKLNTINVEDPSSLRLNRGENFKEGASLFDHDSTGKTAPPTFRASNGNFNNLPSNRFQINRISVANLGKIVGNFAKSAINEMGQSVKSGEFNDAYLKSLNNAFQFLDSSGTNNPFMKLVKDLTFFVIQVFIFLMTLLSVISLVLVTDLRLGELDQSYEGTLVVLESAVGIFFGVEVFLMVISTRGFRQKLRQLFSMAVLTNIFLITEIIISTLSQSPFKRNKVLAIINVLRSLKLIKLRSLVIFTFKEFKKIVKHDKTEIESKNEQNELKNFVYTSAVDIVMGIFIEATLLIAINEMLDNVGYGNTNGVSTNFDYIGASYFAIVSLTTIGYGDIIPVLWESRLFNEVMLFFNISILSSFISTMTQKMYELSPYIKNFYFKNHIVIIGDLPISFFKYFIKELHQCDILSSTVYNQDGQTRLKLSQIILIGREEPPRDLGVWLEDFSIDFSEVRYLKSNVMENLWYKQSNLSAARHLFAFSMSVNESQEQGLESDKQMAYNIQRVVNNYPKLDITLVLSTEFSNQIKGDSLWAGCTVISAQILNEYIMASSLENQGLNIWLTHLATLREKNSSIKSSDLNHLEEYAKNMSQEIYPIKLPSFFIGKTFQEAMKLSYFSTIDLSDSFSFDYNDSLIKKTVPNHSGILLIGIEYKDEIEPTISKFLINPLNYKIRRDDIGYVVAYDQANAKIITNFSEKSPIYSVYLKNMNLFKKLKVVEANNKFIDKMRVEMNERRSEWRIKKEKYFKRNNFKEIPDFNSKFYDIPDIYNLYTDNTPKGIFKNHIIIRGDLFRLKRIASVLRSYSERPILLFSDVQPNPSDWHKIRDTFSNVFYVYGLPTSINHIIQLDPKKAFKILVLSSSYNNFIMDSESIIFTRVLADFFELKNFLTELLDENNLKFISINPKYDNVGSFFWPFFARGSIHFSSLAMSIIAKSINNKSWLSFIRNLTKPNKFAEENSINEKYEQNSRINTLIITAETKKEFQFFGQLQYVLMNHDPQLIGIAVLKVKLTTAEPKKNTFMRQITMNNNDKSKSPDLPKKTEQVFSNHIMKIMEKFYGSEFLMTNPSFLMPLDVGDKVLVIGNTKYEDNNEYYGKISNTSMLLASPKQAKEKIKTQESLSFTIKNEKNHNNNKHEIFKEKLEDNLSSINDFMKFVMGNWDDLNENKMKVTHIKLND